MPTGMEERGGEEGEERRGEEGEKRGGEEGRGKRRRRGETRGMVDLILSAVYLLEAF